jgi:hypothetical protein
MFEHTNKAAAEAVEEEARMLQEKAEKVQALRSARNSPGGRLQCRLTALQYGQSTMNHMPIRFGVDLGAHC